MTKNESSLLEIAIELLKDKRKPQNINKIVEEVTQKKGLNKTQAKEVAPQFITDFMLSGNFVYCGEDTWDLKERQPTVVLDKEGADFADLFDDDEDVKKNELKDDDENYVAKKLSSHDDDEEEDEDEDEEKDDIELELSESDDEDEEEDEDEDDFEDEDEDEGLAKRSKHHDDDDDEEEDEEDDDLDEDLSKEFEE